jgi:inosose dehydratase
MTRPAPTWLPEGVRLGVAPICWTNDVLSDLGGDIPLETCLAEAAAAGYQGIELGHLFPRDARTLRPLLDAHGLDLVSGWYSGFLADRGVEEEWGAAWTHVQLLRDIGCAVLVYGECGRMPGGAPLDQPLSRSPALGPDGWAGYAERHGPRRAAAGRGPAAGVPSSPDDGGRGRGRDRPLMAAAGPAVGLLLDTGHATAAGVDYRRLIDRYGPRIAHVHLKSVRHVFTVPGDGDLDLGAAVCRGGAAAGPGAALGPRFGGVPSSQGTVRSRHPMTASGSAARSARETERRF